MRPSHALHVHRDGVRAIVAQHRVRNARIFGSVARQDDTDASDLDLLVDPTPETTLMDIAALQIAVEALLGVRVDVLTPRALPESFRDRVLQEALPL